MKKINIIHLSSYIFLLFLLTSCGSVKNVAYLQNSDYIDLSRSEYLYDAHIMPKDVLTITVSTVNPEASAPFNLIVHPTLTNTSSNVSTSGGSLQTYLVDNKGLIDFPVLGSLHVGGLSKSECEKMIHDKLLPYLNATENPVVTVRMSNYKMSPSACPTTRFPCLVRSTNPVCSPSAMRRSISLKPWHKLAT